MERWRVDRRSLLKVEMRRQRQDLAGGPGHAVVQTPELGSAGDQVGDLCNKISACLFKWHGNVAN